MKILIPTCKQQSHVEKMWKQMQEVGTRGDVYASCLPESAAINRNFCLSHIDIGEIAIMLDDDIEGFYVGWIDDLLKPLADETVAIVSARLLNTDGSFGPTCSRCYDAEPEEIEITSNGVCVMPTAAIAFRHRGHWFDESFLGSGFEDNDWMLQYMKADPSCRFIQSNKCRLVHRNEMKNQKGQVWKHNEAYFFNKWHGARRMENVPAN